MKTVTNFCRGSLAAAAAGVLLSTTAQGAPKKPEPAPATTEQSAPKKSAGKQKSTADLTKNKKAAPSAPAPDSKATKSKVKPAADSTTPATETTAPTSKKKAAAAKPAQGTQKVASTKAAPATEAVPEPPPKKKGFFKRLFGKKEAEPEAEEPALAKAKTAKPVPVKDIKPVKPPVPAVAGTPPAVEDPKKKRGFFSFLRGGTKEDAAESTVPNSEKIERPADWQDHRVVKEESIGLYEFGPAQSNGPDVRLERGTVVKIKRIEKGWALVQTNTGRSGYLDAASLRNAVEGDFAAPVVRGMATASVSPEAWAPAAPPPDLPDHPSPAALDSESGLLLLPPLELEQKKKPAPAQ